ncbi:MAG: hypothetical protein ACRCSN_01800, partial [Dermatophilaceae bacterium]
MRGGSAIPASSVVTATTDVLAREQAHLEHARDQLRRMREAADKLDASKASDAYSSELLGRVLARRVASLHDDPHTTVFFGRIDTRTEHGQETFHIGPSHLSDDQGDPVVVDWRAPISTAFYRTSPKRADGRAPPTPLQRRQGSTLRAPRHPNRGRWVSSQPTPTSTPSAGRSRTPPSPMGGLDADHGDDEDHQVELVPASIAKGVEFDPGRSSSSRARSSPPSPT